MKSGKELTLQQKWNSKFNAVSVKKSLQNRLKNKLRENAVEEKHSGNRKDRQK